MLHRTRKLLLFPLLLFVLASVFSGTMASAAAEAAVTNLPAGILIGDQEGIRVDVHGYYYIDARGLSPGDVIRKTVTILNFSQNDRSPEGKLPYALSMTAEPLFSSGPVDLLDETHLTIQLDGQTIYDGPCRGDGNPNMIGQALPLGIYAPGDQRTLTFILTVSSDITLSWDEKSEADFQWRFYACREADADPPKTGDYLKTFAFLLPIGLLFLFGLMLIPLKKKRERKMLLQPAGEHL
jgi:hypothetical protein